MAQISLVILTRVTARYLAIILLVKARVLLLTRISLIRLLAKMASLALIITALIIVILTMAL